jgi:two-component sensor histidine kinase
VLAFEDITERRGIDSALRDPLEQENMLLQEMNHRVANSVQIIASILPSSNAAIRGDAALSRTPLAQRRSLNDRTPNLTAPADGSAQGRQSHVQIPHR